MVRAKDLKLKGYKVWNIFLLIILFLALIAAGIEGGYALISFIANPNFFISGEGKRYLPMYIAIWASALLVFVLIIIEIISLAKINRRTKNNLEVKASHFGPSIFVSVMVMLSVIGGWAYYFIANKISLFPFAMGHYLLLGGALFSFIFVLIILLFDLSPIKQIKKLEKKQLVESYKEDSVEVKEEPREKCFNEEYLIDKTNPYSARFELPTLANFQEMSDDDFYELLYKKLMLYAYSGRTKMLNTFLCSDYTVYTIYLNGDENKAVDLDIIFKDVRDGHLYMIAIYHEENSLVEFKIVEHELDDCYQHEIVFIESEDDDKNLLNIAEDYVLAKYGQAYGKINKVVQLVKSVETPYDKQFAPRDRSDSSKPLGAKKKRKVPMFFSVLWAIIKFTIGWFVWLFVQIVLFIIDFFAHTEFAENFKDGFFGRERKIIIEDETGSQHTLTFSSGSYYDESGQRWIKDGDKFYRE